MPRRARTEHDPNPGAGSGPLHGRGMAKGTATAAAFAARALPLIKGSKRNSELPLLRPARGCVRHKQSPKPSEFGHRAGHPSKGSRNDSLASVRITSANKTCWQGLKKDCSRGFEDMSQDMLRAGCGSSAFSREVPLYSSDLLLTLCSWSCNNISVHSPCSEHYLLMLSRLPPHPRRQDHMQCKQITFCLALSDAECKAHAAMHKAAGFHTDVETPQYRFVQVCSYVGIIRACCY